MPASKKKEVAAILPENQNAMKTHNSPKPVKESAKTNAVANRLARPQTSQTSRVKSARGGNPVNFTTRDITAFDISNVTQSYIIFSDVALVSALDYLFLCTCDTPIRVDKQVSGENPYYYF